MMKSKVFLKNLARYALPLLNLLFISYILSGCISSGEPTYLKEGIVDGIRDISKKEYNIDVTAKLIGQTLWIYIPLEDMFEKSDKPEKFIERFVIEDNKKSFENKTLKIEYLIKNVADKEKSHDIKYSKDAMEKINNVWKALRRVLFSMGQAEKGGPQFICLVTADTKNGFEIKELFYIEDLKKVSYNFISWGEYQHRTIQDTAISADIIGDKEGKHLVYKEITWEQFIINQIEHRIKLKFQKPEVEKNADIDKEILRIVASTLKIYGFRDFSSVELTNLLSNNKTTLNQAAIWARPTD